MVIFDEDSYIRWDWKSESPWLYFGPISFYVKLMKIRPFDYKNAYSSWGPLHETKRVSSKNIPRGSKLCMVNFYIKLSLCTNFDREILKTRLFYHTNKVKKKKTALFYANFLYKLGMSKYY